MPTFRYRAYGLDGAVAEGTVDAATSDAASELLWGRGLSPYQLRPATGGGTKWWNRDITIGGGSRRTDLLAFTRDFSMLNAAGIPMDNALHILKAQASTPRLRMLIESLLADVLNGVSLSDAMQKQPEVFPQDYIAIVRAGETGGRLAGVLVELAELLSQRAEIRQRVQSALIYPSLLVVLSVATLSVILGSLIPSIAPIFSQGGKPLPASLGFMLAIRDHWLEIVILIGIVASALAGVFTAAYRKPEGRKRLDHWKLRVPLIGSFLLSQETARFTRTLGSMLKAGVPLSQAAKSSAALVRNRYIAESLDRAIEAIHQGSSLNGALREDAVLPSIALQMIAVGEEAGKLEQMLTNVALMLESEVQSWIDRFMSALTPALTVGIALLVGGLILPVMNAVLSITDMAAR